MRYVVLFTMSIFMIACSTVNQSRSLSSEEAAREHEAFLERIDKIR